jgi:hypothetical protein
MDDNFDTAAAASRTGDVGVFVTLRIDVHVSGEDVAKGDD